SFVVKFSRLRVPYGFSSKFAYTRNVGPTHWARQIEVPDVHCHFTIISVEDLHAFHFKLVSWGLEFLACYLSNLLFYLSARQQHRLTHLRCLPTSACAGAYGR